MGTKSGHQDLNEFLTARKLNTRKDENLSEKITITHTRMPGKGIYGGSYHIPKDEYELFYRLYYEEVFVRKKQDHLTEKQLELGGPICIDLDFRYSYDVEVRQHDADNISEIINLCYLEPLKEFFVFVNGKKFPIYVMEKPHVNRLTDGSLTKDGIHIIIGIQMSKVMQVMLREKALEILPETITMETLPVINDCEAIIDAGVAKGSANWQMYGSCKPGNETYALTHYYEVNFDENDSEFQVTEKPLTEIDLAKDLYKLSAQYPNHPCFEINPKMKEKIEERERNKRKPVTVRRVQSNTRIIPLINNEDQDFSNTPLEDILNQDILDRVIQSIHSKLMSTEQNIKELHDYTMTLPEKYYQPGSHELNRMVAFALKQTDQRLFYTWVKLRSKASDFDYSAIPKLFQDWNKYFKVRTDGVTGASIMYWSKQDSPDEYWAIRKNSVEYCVSETIVQPTDYDFATVLKKLCGDTYVCSSIKDKTWYVFRNHCWVQDKGTTIRNIISTDMYNVYVARRDKTMSDIENTPSDDPKYEKMLALVKQLNIIIPKLRMGTEKNNIMREAMEVLYDEEFDKRVDKNKYLLCCRNGVIDLKNCVFRNGHPNDYITKCTNIEYHEFNPEYHSDYAPQILDLLEKIYPEKELNKYMWDHLSGSLFGENINQTFNIYLGNGSNGKSKITKLMSLTLGDYYGTLPLALITERRNAIGGTSSEVMNLKGVRYACMQEPTKEIQLNEGVMKELTGGDPIVGRQLYKESESFIPQFDLCVCTNILPVINSNDDGTWRRIRVIKHMSKFADPSENITPSEDSPYVFPKDKTLEDKLPLFAETFLSMLVKRAFETQGKVDDCPMVMMYSNNYRQREDHIAAFVSQMIEVVDGCVVKREELSETFKKWYCEFYNSKKIPKGIELFDYMNKKFGHPKKGKDGWQGVAIIRPEVEEDEMTGV
jgi:P4 family phage/plasmid primase-like protien